MRAPHLAAVTALALASAVGPAHARRSATPQDARIEGPPGAWASATLDVRDCSRTRRKFWQSDQGWIVRTVVTCR